MADQYYTRQDGEQVLKTATVVSAGVDSSGRIPALDSTGKLDASVMPVGVTPTKVSVVAYEDMVAGEFVNLFNNGGIISAQKADATDDTKPAKGFILADVIMGATCDVYLPGNINSAQTSLTVGSEYYLAVGAPGAIVSDPTTIGPGNILQRIGIAISATEVIFENTNFSKV